jgi:apyrase
MRPRYSALPNGRQDNSTLADRLHRYRNALLIVLTPLALVSLVLLLMPRPPAASSFSSSAAASRRSGPLDGAAVGGKKYAVWSHKQLIVPVGGSQIWRPPGLGCSQLWRNRG